MPIMKHSKTGRLIAASSNRVDALMAEGYEVMRTEPDPKTSKTKKKPAPKKS